MYKTHITQYFEKTVKKHPDRIAAHEGENSITFAALYDSVLYFAARISECLGGARNRVIAVFAPKSIDTIVADLAILYSGNAYMNLDVKSPPRRLINIFRQTNPDLIICHNPDELPEQMRESTLQVLRDFNKSLSIQQKEQILSLREKCIDTDLLCIINTSGSTGTPKAVALNHRSFIDFTEVIREAGLVGENEVIASLSPAVFDIFSFELCLLMARGATLAIMAESSAAFPARLLEAMARLKATFIFWVPTIMVNIANMDLLSSIRLPDLKMIWFAGEVFPTAKFNYWRGHLPHATFANFYGPIEITLDCLYYIAGRPLNDNEPIPIGIPFRNTSILILDENNRMAEEGELCIRGSSLAMGYYNNPEKTAAAFVQNPLNTAYPEKIYRTGDIVGKNRYGELVFKGRKDTLIKHLGYRIELAEIEHVAVNVVKIVSNCCVVHDVEHERIAMAYEGAAEIPEKDMRHALATILPRYMVPTSYYRFDRLPRNVNGKLDRRLIRQMLASR